MKKLLTASFFIFFSLLASAQMQNLFELAEGNLVFSDILYDNNDDLWGYFYLYKSDKEKERVKMEYVVLDKNLNKVFNGNYYTKKRGQYFVDMYNNCSLLDDKLVLDISLITNDYSKLAYNSNRLLSLTNDSLNNTPEYDEFMLSPDGFLPIPEKVNVFNCDKNTLDSLGNKYLITAIYSNKYKGLLVNQHQAYNSVCEKEMRIYNEKKELQWTYKYNPNTSNKVRDNYTIANFIGLEDSLFLSIENNVVKKKTSTINLAAHHFATGKSLFSYQIQSDTSKYFLNYKTRISNDSIMLYGTYYNNPKLNSYSYWLGYFRIILDKNGNELSKTFQPFDKISTPEYSIAKKAKVNKKYFLINKSSVLFKDGSAAFITQGMHERGIIPGFFYIVSLGILNFDKPYNKNLYIITMDKNFQPSGIHLVEKKKNSVLEENFVFTQYQEEGVSAISCFYNIIKVNGKKEYELLINSIKNNAVQTEKIPLTSAKKYAIIPRPAKEGYIMLNEYNEKDKYNQIRLERLNN